MSSSGDASSMADLGSAFSSGSSGVGSNSFGFTMPSDFSSGAGDSFAGLSGVGSGMSLPTQDAGSNSYGFTSGSGGLPSLQGMQSALGSTSKALGTPTSSTGGGARGAGGGVRLQAQNFQVPIMDYVPVGGSAGGNSLLQLLQKLKPGSTS